MAALQFSDALCQDLNETLFGGVAFTPPAAYDLALFIGNPLDGGVECSGAGYARITVDNDDTTWQFGPSGHAQVFNAIDFEWTASAGAGWGAPNWIGFYTAGGGVCHFAVELDNSEEILPGEPVRVPAGGLSVTQMNTLD